MVSILIRCAMCLTIAASLLALFSVLLISASAASDHYGFTTWMAGGGVRGGMTYGETDHFGFRAAHNKVHIHDLHATILYLLGIDHEKLTYRYSGRDFRLTDVHGRILHDIIA